MKKFIAIIILLCISFAAAAQENYKLGDFNASQVKAKTVNIGGSWTVMKNSTTKGLEFYYGNSSMATLSTTGVLTVTSVPSLTVTGVLTSSSLTRGSAAFSAALTRVAVYVPGITTVSYVLVQPTAVDGATRPVAGDFLNVKLVTDSIIVMRQAGTTANLAFDWFRIN